MKITKIIVAISMIGGSIVEAFNISTRKPASVVENIEKCSVQDLADALNVRTVRAFVNEFGFKGCKKTKSPDDMYPFVLELYFGLPGNDCSVEVSGHTVSNSIEIREFCTDGGAWQIVPGFFGVETEGSDVSKTPYWISAKMAKEAKKLHLK